MSTKVGQTISNALNSTTAPVSKKEAFGELSSEINNYLEQHGISVEMNTDYALDAFTLKADPSKMVLVMDSKKASGKHVTYR